MPLSLPEIAREGPYVLDEEVRLLERCEVAASGHLAPAPHVVGFLDEAARRGLEHLVARECGDADRLSTTGSGWARPSETTDDPPRGNQTAVDRARAGPLDFVAYRSMMFSNGRGEVVAVGGEFWCLGEVPRADRPAQWKELLSHTHLPWTVRVTKPGQDRAYEAWVRRQWIDDLALVDCECGPCAGSRGRAELSDTDGEYVAVLITRSGRETVAQEGAEAYMRPGDAVAWDSTRPARFEVLEPLVKRSLLIPRCALDEVSGRAWTSAGVLLDGEAPAVRLLTGYLDALSGTLPDLSMASVTAARNATLELFVGALQPGGPVDSSTVGPALRANMERWIERHLSDGEISPAALAAAHSVSVRTVYRVFEMTGETVGEVVRIRRLAKARKDLTESGEPISTIAYRWRFSDSSHFSKAFKAHYGVSPSEYRALSRARGDGERSLALG